jgi:hypothetical protein
VVLDDVEEVIACDRIVSQTCVDVVSIGSECSGRDRIGIGTEVELLA